MPSLSSDQIRDVAVQVVQDFLNDKVPLNQGLAKQAQAHDMNYEQVKRACEASNVIAHLKIMQLSDDKTTEFPLCDSNKVMAEICNPGPNLPNFEKSAGLQEQSCSSELHSFTSSASDNHVYFVKQAAINERALQDLQVEMINVQRSLVKAALDLSKNKDWIEKLSCVADEDFAKLSLLVGGKVETKRNVEGLFKEAALKEARNVAELYKQAKSMVSDAAKMKDMDERSKSLTKEAALASMIGRGIGYVAGKAANVLATPVTRPVAAYSKLAVNKVANTGPGKFFGVKPMALSAKETSLVNIVKNPPKAIKTVGKFAPFVAIDAGMHHVAGGPGLRESGASKDVWQALQN